MISLLTRTAAVCCLLAATATHAGAQAEPKLDDKAVADVVARLDTQLNTEYPLQELGQQYRKAVHKAWHGGRYHGLPPCELAQRIADDLQATHRDRHLNVWCAGPEQVQGPVLARPFGHGFLGVTLDPDLSLATIKAPGPWDFDDASFEAASHVMALAADAKNVVIDLRGNPGGHGEIGYFLASYFLSTGEAVAFERGLYHPPRQADVAYTFPYVPGRKLSDARLYLLVDANTGSAAEGFAFGMQKMKRATVVGQATAGAGIAGHVVDLGHGVAMFSPFKLVVAVDSAATFEGTGVIPDRQTAPGEEMSTVTALVQADRKDAEAHDGLELFASGAKPAAAEAPPLPDPARNMEACQVNSTGADGALYSMLNQCGRAVTVQYMSSAHPNVVYEQRVGPGDKLQWRPPVGNWWMMAVCPEGYFNAVPLSREAMPMLARGDYACVRQQVVK